MSKTVLLIVDQDELRLDMACVLMLEDFELITAKNAEEGIALCGKKSPDAIILSASNSFAPALYGLTLLKEHEVTREVPLWLVLDKVSKAEALKSLELGALGIILRDNYEFSIADKLHSALSKIPGHI